MTTGSTTDYRRRALMWCGAAMAVALCYFVIFFVTRDQPVAFILRAVARNILSLALSVWIVRALLVQWCLRLRGIRFWVGQATLAMFFTLLWAWLLNLTEGLIGSGSAVRFAVNPVLAGTAITWQLLQGLFVYVAVAAIVMLERRPNGTLVVIQRENRGPSKQLLVKAEDELAVLSSEDIVSITGADDYSQLVTIRDSHLVSTSLADFEQMLDNAHFVRVHRSAIANLRHMKRAEPAGGGRMILRMLAGPDLPVSRAGARLLRQRAL